MPESAVNSVLVVGCGYIGLPFARLAKANGCRVYATTRKRERLAALAAQGFEPVRWDVTEGAVIAEKLISTGVPTEANARQIRDAYREIRESKNDALPTVNAVIYCV